MASTMREQPQELSLAPDTPAAPPPVHEPSAAERLATRTAERIDRRRFLRKAAKSSFFILAGLAAGGGLDILTARPAEAGCGRTANGPGCPTGGHYGTAPCGPSRCCNYVRPGYPTSCKCGSGGSCVSGTTHCRGRNYYYSSGCWSCYGPAYPCKQVGCYCRLKVTCCDCATRSCGDSSGRCVSWYTTTQFLGC